MDNVTIKKCPFCGGAACLTRSYSYKTRSYFVYVKCDVCGGQGKIYRSAEDPAEEKWENSACQCARVAWNLRTE